MTTTTAQSIRPLLDDALDVVTHSPDGESRGLMFRVGDIFPLDPRPHQRSRIEDPASEARPWGLRYLRAPQPRAGKHESGTGKHTTGGGDNQGPEDEGTD
jgi:hypothetical protein